jgi:Leucine-rich repeat (LRR) protein
MPTMIFKHTFISYGRRESLSFVARLHRLMKLAGFDAWFDKVNIPDGEDYALRISNGIETAHNFVFVIAPRSMESVYCLVELEYARILGKRVIPIAQYSWVSGTDKPIAEADKAMMKAFYERHGQPQVVLETEKDVVARAYFLIGRTDWLHAKENISPEDVAEMAKWAAEYENLFREHDNLAYLQDCRIPQFGKSIDELSSVFLALQQLLERHRDYVEQHTEILADALIWDSNAQKTQFLLVGEERKKAQKWLTYRFPYGEQAPCTPCALQIDFLSDSRKNAENLMTDAFICYSVADKELTKTVMRLLMREGFTTWIHSEDIEKGSDFASEINRGIEDSSFFLFFMSKNSLTSRWCLKELNYALSLNKKIIPLKIENFEEYLLPKNISNLQFVDFTDNKTEEDFKKDIDSITRNFSDDEEYYRQHRTFLSLALRWQRQLQKPTLLLRGYNLESANYWLNLNNQRKEHSPTDLHRAFIAESNLRKSHTASDVFISYSRKDADFARKLNRHLQEAGKTTWFDQESISEGVDFDAEILKGISIAHNFLFIISPDSLASKFCDIEIRHAAVNGKRFIPVLYRESENAPQIINDISPEYAKIHWTKFDDRSKFEDRLIVLIQAIDRDYAHVQAHTKWQQWATEWFENGKNNDFLLNSSAYESAQKWLTEADAEQKNPPVTDLQRDFIARSEKAILAAEKKERAIKAKLEKRLRVTFYASGVAFLLLFVAAFFIFKSEKNASIARKAKDEVLKEKLKTEEHLQKNEKLVSAMYFYNDSIALAYNTTKKFHFINKEGVHLEYLGEDYESAVNFSSGIAEVTKDDKKYLLSDVGETFFIAENLDNFKTEHNALRIREYLTSIDPKILQAKQLQYLSIRGHFSELPERFSGLTELKILYIAAPLKKLPDNFSDLTQLRKLEFVRCDFQKVPDKIYELNQPEFLAFWICPLGEVHEDIGDLTSLKTLIFYDNNLTELPKTIGNLVKLEKIVISSNRIQKLPTEFSALKSLKILEISNDSLNAFPEMLTELPILSKLDLTGNQIKNVPKTVKKLKNLKELSLAGNKLRELPLEFWDLSNLEELKLSSNLLPELPNDCYRLSKLSSLYLSENKISSLPNSLGLLSKLRRLDVSKNFLQKLPDSIGKLKKLEFLILNDNQLTYLPKEIGDCRELTELNLNNNTLTGLPAQINQLSKLQNLSLANNKLTVKKIPPLNNLKKLNSFDISNNQLGTLPAVIFALKNLTWLNLDNNQLPILPKDVRHWKEIQTLYVQGNQLSALPAEINDCKKLSELYLSNNKFKLFPTEITALHYLSWLEMTDNELTELPEEVKNLTNLLYLDLSNNLFTKFPEELCELPNLETLHLGGNSLTELPSSVKNLKSLAELTLIGNNFSESEKRRAERLLPNCTIIWTEEE